MGIHVSALKKWAMFAVALILLIAGIRGKLGDVLAALLVPQDLQE